MYQYIKVSSRNSEGDYVKSFKNLSDALQYINHHKIRIIQPVMDAAGNVTGFLCENKEI